MTWRLHAEPNSKVYAKGPHWRYCDDQHCPLDHRTYDPFVPMIPAAGGEDT